MRKTMELLADVLVHVGLAPLQAAPELLAQVSTIPRPSPNISDSVRMVLCFVLIRFQMSVVPWP